MIINGFHGINHISQAAGWWWGRRAFHNRVPQSAIPMPGHPAQIDGLSIGRVSVANAIRCAFPAPHKVRDHNYASNSEIYYILPSIWWQDCRLQYNCNKDRKIKSPNSIGIIYNCPSVRPVRGMLILSSVMGTLPSAVLWCCAVIQQPRQRDDVTFIISLYTIDICALKLNRAKMGNWKLSCRIKTVAANK